MKSPAALLPMSLGLTLGAMSPGVLAVPPASLHFVHHDWEIACDNTRTCRAAGYQRDDDALPVSVLLTRRAGAGQAVTGELMIGTADDDKLLEALPPVVKLSMRVNQRDLGEVAIPRDTLVARLSPVQVDALLAALPRNSLIEWTAGGHRWRLSDKGAAAALLKMDEFQRRVGTKGALVKKGAKGESGVLPPLSMPVVHAGPLAEPRPGDGRLPASKSKVLRDALVASLKNDDCADLVDTNAGQPRFSIVRLTDSKLLVSTQCWGAAYNTGYGYWVVDDGPELKPVLVTTSGSEYDAGSITAAHKGRGLGDCWSSEVWTWDGTRFVHTESSTTGMCKMVAPGGAWALTTLVSDVRRPAQ